MFIGLLFVIGGELLIIHLLLRDFDIEAALWCCVLPAFGLILICASLKTKFETFFYLALLSAAFPFLFSFLKHQHDVKMQEQADRERIEAQERFELERIEAEKTRRERIASVTKEIQEFNSYYSLDILPFFRALNSKRNDAFYKAYQRTQENADSLASLSKMLNGEAAECGVNLETTFHVK